MSAIVANGRFIALPIVMVIAVIASTAGGAWSWAGGLLLIFLVVIFDEAGGDYREGVDTSHQALLNSVLYAALPAAVLLVSCLLLVAASPGTPVAQLSAVLGMEGRGLASVVGSVVSVGLLLGAAAGGFGHELMHRSKRLDWWFGQCLLALCLYTPLAIEHVFGHHRNVGTSIDIATVPRGQSFWRYLLLAIAGVHRGAARIESARMKRRRRPWYHFTNRFMRGILLEIFVVAAVLMLAGPGGLAAFIASAGIAIFVIEVTNYVGHYGLVRAPGEPVMPRHSWNAPRFISSSMMVNLPRHSHHHLSAMTPFWRLKVVENAPVYPYGTSIMSGIALLPPLWSRVLAPHLSDWDKRLASPAERAILAAQAR